MKLNLIWTFCSFMTYFDCFHASDISELCQSDRSLPGFRTRLEENNFLEEIFANHSVTVMPHGLCGNRVAIIADLFQIVNVDERNGLIDLKIFLYIWYFDELLQWNAEEKGTSFVNVARDQVWQPDLVHLDVTEIKYEDSSNTATIYNDGLIIPTSRIQYLQIACELDVAKFPYDEQSCSFRIGQWNTNFKDYELFVPEESQMPLSAYIQSDQWELIPPVRSDYGVRLFSDGFANETFRYDYVKYTFHMRRRPVFYQNIILFPTMTFLFLSSLVFVLPVESGEKVSLGLTLLLSQSVSLIVLMDILPPSGNNFPNLGGYVLCSILVTAISVLIAVGMIVLYSREEPLSINASNLLLYFPLTLSWSFSWCKLKNKTSRISGKCFPAGSRDKIKNIEGGNEDEADEESNELKKEIQLSGKEAVDILDNFCFKLFILVSSVITIWFFAVTLA